VFVQSEQSQRVTSLKLTSTQTDPEIFLQYVISLLTLIEKRIVSGELSIETQNDKV